MTGAATGGTLPSPATLAAVLVALALLVWPSRLGARWTPGRGPSPATAGHNIPRPVPVAEVLELLALSLAGGGGLPAGMATTAAALPGTQGEVLATVARALAEGADPQAAWERAGPAWEPVRRGLRLALEAGVPPTGPLLQAAGDLRGEATTRVEVATARLAVRLVVPLGLCFLPAFVLTSVVPLVLALTRGLSW